MKNLKVTVNGIPYEVQIEEVNSSAPATLVKTAERQIQTKTQSTPNRQINNSMNNGNPSNNGVANNNKKGIVAPMPGLIKQIKVLPNQQVQTGDIILVLEAMKLENEIRAKNSGEVKEILVEEGQTVSQGAVLVVIE